MAAPLGKYVMFHFYGSAHMVVTLLVKAKEPNKSFLKSNRLFLFQNWSKFNADHSWYFFPIFTKLLQILVD